MSVSACVCTDGCLGECSSVAFISKEAAGVRPPLSALLREGHLRTACLRFILPRMSAEMVDVNPTAVASFVLCEAAEIQASTSTIAQ